MRPQIISFADQKGKIQYICTLTFSELALAHEVIDPLHGFFVALEKVFVAHLVDEVLANG